MKLPGQPWQHLNGDGHARQTHREDKLTEHGRREAPENAVRCMCLRNALRRLMQHAAMAGAPHCII